MFSHFYIYKPQRLVMKSKVLMLALAAATISLTSKAQSKAGDATTTFGIRAGVNFTNVTGKDQAGNDLSNDKLKTGFNIGVNAEIPIAPDFYVQPGLLFSTKGTKVKQTGDDFKINISYIEVPINLLYKPEFSGGKLLLGVGPYFGFGIGGKAKAGSQSEDVKFKSEVKMADYNSAYYVKGFDAGGNLLVGYELSSKISAQLNAQLGMVKINSKITDFPGGDKGKAKNTGFGISLGYRF